MYPNGDTQYRAIKITLIFNCLSKLLPNMFISLVQTHIFKTSIKTELIILNAPIGEVVCLSNSRQELMSINLRHPQKTLNLHPQRKVSHFPGGQGPGAKSSIQMGLATQGLLLRTKGGVDSGACLQRKRGEELCRSLHSHRQPCVRQAAGSSRTYLTQNVVQFPREHRGPDQPLWSVFLPVSWKLCVYTSRNQLDCLVTASTTFEELGIGSI